MDLDRPPLSKEQADVCWTNTQGYIFMRDAHKEHLLNARERYYGNVPDWFKRRVGFLPNYLTLSVFWNALASPQGYFDEAEENELGSFMREKHLVKLIHNSSDKKVARKAAQELKRLGYVQMMPPALSEDESPPLLPDQPHHEPLESSTPEQLEEMLRETMEAMPQRPPESPSEAH